MSYTFLLAQGEESSVESFSDMLRFAPWRSSLIADKSSCSGSGMGSCRGSQYGMMSALSTGDLGGELRMSSAVDSPARTSASPEAVQGSPEKEAGCGRKWPVSLARFDRATLSWRTHQLSLEGDWELFSGTWPRWGMMRGGECWERMMPEHRTEENAFGFWLPTQKSSDATCGDCPSERRRNSPSLVSAVKMFPPLTVSGKYNRNGAGAGRLWPTLTAQDAKNNGAPSQAARNTLPLNAEIGGPLNPEWCEWLMGWARGWTELEPWGTDRFRLWRQWLGGF